MANLVLSQMYNDKLQRTGAQSSEVTFTNAFVAAANNVITDMGNRTGESPTIVADTDGDPTLDEKYWTVLSAGIDYYLTVQSEWRIESKDDLYALYQQKLAEAGSLYLKANPPTGRLGVAVG